MTENILNGAAPADVLAELVNRGVPSRLALRTLQELESSPIFAAALAPARWGRRLELVQRLLTIQMRQARHPAAVERRTTPSADELFDRYLATSTPVVITDLVPAWPAFGKWSPEYLSERYGEVLVHFTDQREADPFYDANTNQHTRSSTLREFVERLGAAGETNDFYMVAKNKNIANTELVGLFEDVRLPDGWFDAAQLLTGSALWLGPAGTVTPLHHDASSILFCQIYGKKRILLASPLEVSLFDGAHEAYSAVDPENAANDPRAQSVTFKDVTLEAGEALFLPAGWWHHIRALSVSISLGVNHFACDNDFDAWFMPGTI
jgi:hypothetical protein